MPLPLGAIANLAKGVGAQALKHPHLASAAVQGAVGAGTSLATGGGVQGALAGGLGGAATGAATSYLSGGQSAQNAPAQPESTSIVKASLALPRGALAAVGRSALPGAVGGAASGFLSADEGEGLQGALAGGLAGGAAGGLAGGFGSGAGKAPPRSAASAKQISVMPMQQPQLGHRAQATLTSGGKPQPQLPAPQLQLPAPAPEAPQAAQPYAQSIPRPRLSAFQDSRNQLKEASDMAMNAQEEVLYNSVYLPAFIEKCSARGFEIGDTDSLNSALDIAALTKQHQVKTANNVVKTAADSLRRSMGLPVVSTQKAAALVQADTRAKQAGLALSQVPEVRQAFLALANSAA